MNAAIHQTLIPKRQAEREKMRKPSSILIVVALVLAFALLPVQSADAQVTGQWSVWYWPNIQWAGPAVFSQSISSLAFNWGFEVAPGPGLPNINWSARATTVSYFPAGLYRFTVLADDDFRLIVDGVTYIDTVGRGQSGKTQTFDLPLVQGNHTVQVDFIQYTGAAYLFASWQWMSGGGAPPAPWPDNQPPIPMPSQSQVITDFGDFTPCIQQGIHQKFCFVSNGAWDAPNYGSIEMEPPVVVWSRCHQDTQQTMQLYQNRAAQAAKCSKTQAGWFPM